MDGNVNRSRTKSLLYDGEFFDIISTNEEYLFVRCKICLPDVYNHDQLLRISVKSNGNTLKHIQRHHSELLQTIKAAKNVITRRPRNMKRGQMKQYKKKVVEIKLKKQHEVQLLDGGGKAQVYIANDDGDSVHTNQDLYVLESVDGIAESDKDDCGENISGGDEINDENSLLTAPEIITSSTYKRVSNGSSNVDRSLIEFQKKLMQAEFDHMKKLRDEKHQLEIEFLKAEHHKRMELLNKKSQD